MIVPGRPCQYQFAAIALAALIGGCATLPELRVSRISGSIVSWPRSGNGLRPTTACSGIG
jgi:hypothetical protein